MRRLWIEWQESAVGSLKKMRVYIEDRENSDTLVGDVPCRKLGEVKCGQQKRFSVSEDEAKVFVTGGKVGPKARCPFVQIPEGREDVFLSGTNRGNTFRYENTPEEAVRESAPAQVREPLPRETGESLEPGPEEKGKPRKTGAKLLLAAVILCILAAAAVGGLIGTRMILAEPEPAQSHQFSVRELQITMTEEFTQKEAAGATACYAAPDAAVFFLREAFSLREDLEAMTVEQYGELLLENNGLTCKLQSENGMTVFDYVYTDPGSEEAFYCYTVLLKGPDAFWTVRFCATAEATRDRLPDFRQWAASIRMEA